MCHSFIVICILKDRLKDVTVKQVVLRSNLDESKAEQLTDQKKTSMFRSVLSKPKKEEVHVHSLNLIYECITRVSGKYVADYYRSATHTISVDHNVREIVFGEGVFPIREKSKLSKTLGGKHSKNKIDLNLEEHVFIETSDEIYFDHHGDRTSFSIKLKSENLENYPKRVLDNSNTKIRKSEKKHDDLIDELLDVLKTPIKGDVRNITDEFTLDAVTEIYVPIFEARLVGPKKKVKILRIDAAQVKII